MHHKSFTADNQVTVIGGRNVGDEYLQAGVKLFELKPQRFAGGGPDQAGAGGLPGSSAASLHAKTLTVDAARIFVGSFNFDPRSARLNTEMGFVMEAPGMASTLADAFARELPARAYEVRLAPDDGLRWIERTDAGEVVHEREPGTGWWQRAGVAVLSWLPIEWLL